MCTSSPHRVIIYSFRASFVTSLNDTRSSETRVAARPGNYSSNGISAFRSSPMSKWRSRPRMSSSIQYMRRFALSQKRIVGRRTRSMQGTVRTSGSFHSCGVQALGINPLGAIRTNELPRFVIGLPTTVPGTIGLKSIRTVRLLATASGSNVPIVAAQHEFSRYAT